MIELVGGPYDGKQTQAPQGNHITFPVAPPLVWRGEGALIDLEEDVEFGQAVYERGGDGRFHYKGTA